MSQTAAVYDGVKADGGYIPFEFDFLGYFLILCF